MMRFSIAYPITDLMHANLLEVFNQRDHAARRAAITLLGSPGKTAPLRRGGP
jgi:hypothetical protein